MLKSPTKVNYNKLLSTSGIVFVGGILISFVSSWLLTKVLDKESVGIYQMMFTILETGALIATAGFQLLAVREIPQLIKNQEKISLFIKNGLVTMFLVLTLLIPIIYIAVYYLTDPSTPILTPLVLTCCILPAFVILKFFSSVIHGFQKIHFAIFPEKIIRPMATLLLAIALYFLGTSYDFNLIVLLLLFGVFSVFTGMLFYASIQKLSKDLWQKNRPVKNYYKAAFALLPIVVLANLNIKVDSFMIVGLDDIENYAIYAQSAKFASLCAIGLLIYDHVFAPQISIHVFEQNKKEINRFIIQKIRLVLVFSLIIFVLVTFFGEMVLSTFGKKVENYSAGYVPLVILAIGQIIHVLFGPVSNILIMTKNEKYSIWSMVIALIINIVLNVFLIPLYGITGAAIATALGLISSNILMYYFVRTKTDFKSAAFD